MVIKTLTPLKELSELEQAIYFHARQRRRSILSGIPGFQTHLFGIPTATIDAAQFPDRTQVVTFRTAVRITGPNAEGLLFEIGNSTTGLAACVNRATITIRAGDAASDDRAFATFTNAAGQLEVGREIDLVFAVSPGDGRVRIYGDGEEFARDTAVNGQFPNGWAASSDGSFATGVNGTTPADVDHTAEPFNFDVIQSLSVYVGSVPRQFA